MSLIQSWSLFQKPKNVRACEVSGYPSSGMSISVSFALTNNFSLERPTPGKHNHIQSLSLDLKLSVVVRKFLHPLRNHLLRTQESFKAKNSTRNQSNKQYPCFHQKCVSLALDQWRELFHSNFGGHLVKYFSVLVWQTQAWARYQHWQQGPYQVLV